MTFDAARLRRFLRADGLMLLLALAGAAAYVFLLPSQHPDAAAHFRLGAAAATETATTFLAEHGFAAADLEGDAELRRDDDLLVGLQRALGRPGAVAALADGAAPAYYWRVELSAVVGDGEEEDEAERALRYTVRMTPDGEVWGFEVEDADEVVTRPDHRPDRAVLAAALSGADEGGLPSLVSDSLLAAALRFGEGDSLWATRPARLAAPANPFPVLAEASPSVRTRIELGPSAAAALARAHLARTPWQRYDLQPDSLWLVRRDDAPALAHVRFATAEPMLGQTLAVDVLVRPTGGLAGMEATWEAVDEPGDLSGIMRATGRGAAYVVLILVLFVAFVRRLMNRMIDVRAALMDGAVLGLLTAVFLGMLTSVQFSTGLPFWGHLLIQMLVMSIAGSAVAVFFFMLAAAVDSMAREVWAGKLLTGSLLRRGLLVNGNVGASLLRGVGVALLLLGLTAVFLRLAPAAAMPLETEFPLAEAVQPMAWVAALQSIATYLVVLLLVGAGTLLVRRHARPVVVLGGLTVLGALLGIGLVDVDPVGYLWALGALVGLVAAAVLLRHDVLTVFVGLFLSGLLWKLSPGWLMDAAPWSTDVLLGVLLVVGVLALGFIGVLSGTTPREAREYVPTYLRQLAEEERLQRELEIAHQVQHSFLPRRMPEVEGLDLAAMCRAAQEVGGDYYDFMPLGDGRLGVVVGDVSGKGIPAAFYMTLTKGYWQTLSRDLDSPAEVLRRLNTLFCHNAARGTFISMIYGIVDVQAGTFTFARAGHNPVILKRSPSQRADLVQPAGMAIGLVSGERFDQTIEEAVVDLRDGDVLVFYTDGFSEATNPAREQYGDDRLAETVGRVGRRTARDILRAVNDDVETFIDAADQHDDMTMVVLKVGAAARLEPIAADRRRLGQADPAAVLEP